MTKVGCLQLDVLRPIKFRLLDPCPALSGRIKGIFCRNSACWDVPDLIWEHLHPNTLHIVYKSTQGNTLVLPKLPQQHPEITSWKHIHCPPSLNYPQCLSTRQPLWQISSIPLTPFITFILLLVCQCFYLAFLWFLLGMAFFEMCYRCNSATVNC